MLPASALKAMLCSENPRLGKRPKFMGDFHGISMLDDWMMIVPKILDSLWNSESSRILGASWNLVVNNVINVINVIALRLFQCTIKIRIIHRWMESAPYLERLLMLSKSRQKPAALSLCELQAKTELAISS